MVTTDVRTPLGRIELANQIERLVKHELMMRYDVPMNDNVELDVDKRGRLLMVEPYVGAAPLADDLPPRYATMIETAIYLRDMDGAA